MQLGKRLDSPLSTPRALLRHWRARGLLRPALVLLVVLFVVLAEPLACILHCELHPSALPHQHHQQHLAAASLRQRPFHPLTATTDVGALPVSSNCFQAAGSNPAPAIPPSPVHELVLGLGLALIGVAQIHRLGRPAPLPPPGMRRTPPTPPPRRPLPALHATV